MKKKLFQFAGPALVVVLFAAAVAVLENGCMSSVFFRFPGLVSDRQVFKTVLGYGLIPIGSDAWLAKGESPKNGSIVLIHANGNEPLGVRKFIALLKKEHTDALEKKWMLFDLRKSVVENEWNNRNKCTSVRASFCARHRFCTVGELIENYFGLFSL